MKIQALLSFLIVCSIDAFAQSSGWTELGSGSNALNANGGIYSICTDSAGNVYASGDFMDDSGYFYVAGWDGVRWNELNDSTNGLNENYSINDICADDVNIYAASSVLGIHGHVAEYSSFSWDTLPSLKYIGMNDPLIYSLCTDRSGNLYAGGDLFDSSNISCIIKWDAVISTWIKIPISIPDYTLNASIFSISADDSGNIYAAGSGFDTTSYNVMKFDGAKWNWLGSGSNALKANNYISSLCTDEHGNVYAAGEFTNGSGNEYVAKWDGLTWKELGGSNSLKANNYIKSICIDGFGNVYAAGYFTNSSGNEYVACWDGMNWSELGGGSNALNANSGIYSICADGKENIYAAGWFTDPSGFRYVAKYHVLTGIDDLKNEDDFSIYPNPAKEIVSIYVKNSMAVEEVSI